MHERSVMNIEPTTNNPNNARELTVEITRDEFEDWVIDYRHRNQAAGDP